MKKMIYSIAIVSVLALFGCAHSEDLFDDPRPITTYSGDDRPEEDTIDEDITENSFYETDADSERDHEDATVSVYDDPAIADRYERLLEEYAPDGSPYAKNDNYFRNEKYYPLEQEVVEADFSAGVIQIDDYVIYCDGRMTVLDVLEKIDGSQERDQYDFYEYGIENEGMYVPGTEYLFCQKVTLIIHKARVQNTGYSLYAINDRPELTSRSPAFYKVIGVSYPHNGIYAMGIDGSKLERQYETDKALFDKVISSYPIYDMYGDRPDDTPGNTYLTHVDENQYTDEYAMRSVAVNPIQINGKDYYAIFQYRLEEHTPYRGQIQGIFITFYNMGLASSD